MTSTDFGKFPGKQLVESYFSTVTGLAILLKQVPTTGVFVKTFQNFYNRYLLCNTSRRLLLNLETILIVPTPSFLPYFYVGTRRGGSSTAPDFMLEVFLASNALSISKHINTIQYIFWQMRTITIQI